MAVKGTVYSCGGFETVGGDAGEGETVGGASARSEEEGWKWAATLLTERNHLARAHALNQGQIPRKGISKRSFKTHGIWNWIVHVMQRCCSTSIFFDSVRRDQKEGELTRERAGARTGAGAGAGAG